MNFDNLVHRARQHCSDLPAETRRTLAAGQSPVALFITCSDSRIVPAHITGAEQGRLFELRTAGNVVPQYDPDSPSSEMATIEYALLVLQVPEVIVCGHSHCGAVTALSTGCRGLDELPALRTWLNGNGGSNNATCEAPSDPSVRTESKRHLREQLRVLSEYPFVRERLEAGTLRMHGWFYEIDTGLVFTTPRQSSDEEMLPL